jgi:hypothetical protein
MLWYHAALALAAKAADRRPDSGTQNSASRYPCRPPSSVHTGQARPSPNALLSDAEFAAAFESASLPEFSHADHLRLAYIYARRGGSALAVEGARGLRAFAEAHGAYDKFHETITVAWARVVAHLVASSEAQRFDDFLREHPELLDRRLLSRYYSEPRLMSATARKRFIEPDLLPLP